MKVPPRWVRRLLLSPLPVLLLALMAGASPLILVFACIFSYRLPGKWRALRVVGLFAFYVLLEATLIIVMFGLWLGSGFGWKRQSLWYRDAHYGLLGWALDRIVWATEHLFNVSIRSNGEPLPGKDDDPTTLESPLIVMSRHAGPADSLLVVHEIMSWPGRRPRIIAKDLLQLDPALDVLLNRLPNRFISPNPKPGAGTIESISELASTMTEQDAFVIFPEGGNFTTDRRLKAIDRLRASGRVAAAERAVELRNVLPPRPSGVKAALAACPHADAVFLAHAGLDDIVTVGDVWTALPAHKTVRMAWHVVEAEAVPHDEQDQEEMLYLAWDAIDAWVEEESQSPGVSGVGVE